MNTDTVPIVPIRKSLRPGEKKADFRICDYSVIVNSQLEPHRYPMPLSCHLLEENFAHFGYPHTLVTDNTLTSEEFQQFLRARYSKHERSTLPSSYKADKRSKNRVPRWIPAVVVQILGPRHVLIQGVPKGPTWKRHVEQLRPRHGVDEDDDPGMVPGPTPTSRNIPFSTTVQTKIQPPRRPRGRPRGRRNFQWPNLQDPELTLPRRSERLCLKVLGDSSAGAEDVWRHIGV